MDRKPNLLFILTDQQRYDTLAAYGNHTIKVPNLNELASESLVFNRAYTTQPVCTPSRGSIHTGLYPHNHGCMKNNTLLSGAIPTIGAITKKAGYRNGYIGKWHLGDEMIKQRGFDEWISTEEARKAVSKEEYATRNSDYHYYLLNCGFLPDKESEHVSEFSRYFCTRIPEEYSKPAFGASIASRFIESNKNSPFILFVNFLEPHSPYNSAFDDLYDPADVELPPCFNAEPAVDTPLKYRYNRKYQREIGKPYPLVNESIWRKLISRYWGAISLVDKYVGKILDSLRQNGLEDNTIVVFTSDHGDMMGDFRMGQKAVMYESAVRVPLLLRMPGKDRKKSIIDTPVSQVDLLPTLLDAMGISADIQIDGSSLLPFLSGAADSLKKDVYIEWNGDDGGRKWFKAYLDGADGEQIKRVYGAGVRTIVTPEGWKMSISQAGENELYNLTEDPHEFRNLYYSEDYASVINELRGKLADLQRDSGDQLRL